MSIPSFWQPQVPGSQLTSIKVGGVVDFLAKVSNQAMVEESLKAAEMAHLPIHVLGGGSDVLLSDAGLRGVLLQPHFMQKELLEGEAAGKYEKGVQELLQNAVVHPRYITESAEYFLQLEDSSLEEGKRERTLFEFGAGTPLGSAVAYSLRENAIGLHWFARIPCLIGGAVYNNIHGGAHFLSEYIAAVRAYNLEERCMKSYSFSELAFGYDYSIFHETSDIIISVIMALPRVTLEEKEQALTHYRDWTKEKARVQPAGANAGSVFKNLTPEQQAHSGQTMTAAAWYIDQCGLKGQQIGQMQIYTSHANFIINLGGGTQADFVALVQLVRQRVHERFDIWLEPEVECWDVKGKPLSW